MKSINPDVLGMVEQIRGEQVTGCAPTGFADLPALSHLLGVENPRKVTMSDLLKTLRYGDVLSCKVRESSNKRWTTLTIYAVHRWNLARRSLELYYNNIVSAAADVLVLSQEAQEWPESSYVKVVLEEIERKQIFVVSTLPADLKRLFGGAVCLGVCEAPDDTKTEGKMQTQFSHTSPYHPGSLQHLLHQCSTYGNPNCVPAMQDSFKVDKFSSLLTPPQNTKTKYVQLREDQDNKSSQSCVIKGIELSKSGKYSEAIKYYKRALEWNVKNADAYVGLGAVEANTNQYDSALREFETALRIDPENKNARKYRDAIKGKLEKMRLEQQEHQDRDAAKAKMLDRFSGASKGKDSTGTVKKDYDLVSSSEGECSLDGDSKKRKRKHRKDKKKKKKGKKKSKHKKDNKSKKRGDNSSSDSSTSGG